MVKILIKILQRINSPPSVYKNAKNNLCILINILIRGLLYILCDSGWSRVSGLSSTPDRGDLSLQ